MVTVEDAEKVLTRPKGWWAYLTCLFLAKRLSVFIVNHTKFSANQITLFASFLQLISAFLFLGGHKFYLLAAFFYWLSYVFDCVDGTVARLKKNTTLHGGYVDSFTDLFAELFVVIGFSLGFYWEHGGIQIFILSIIYIFLVMYFYFDGQFIARYLSAPKIISTKKRGRYFNFFDKRDLVAHPRKIEAAATIFVVGPIIGNVLLFYYLGLSVLVVAVVLKIYIHYRLLRQPSRELSLLKVISSLSEVNRIVALIEIGQPWSVYAMLGVLNSSSLAGNIDLFSFEDNGGTGLPRNDFLDINSINKAAGRFYFIPFVASLENSIFTEVSDILTKKGLVHGEDYVGVTFPAMNKDLYRHIP